MQSILAVLTLGLGLASGPVPTQTGLAAVEVSTTTLTIPTYPYAGFLETRHSDAFNMDYHWLNWSAYEATNRQALPRDYTAVVVENPWLRLTFLPELGGRLYGATVRATGEELLYQNPVIKPTHWGPSEQGWWLAAGGIEWCLPVDEHGYEWSVPWSYRVALTAEGATVTLWDTAATDRVRAQISIDLPNDQAAFHITSRLENPTAVPVTLKFWDNAMLAPGTPNSVGPELRFVVPIDQITVHSRGDDHLPGPGRAMDWPVHKDTDYSRLGNWNHWLGFFARPQAESDWVGVYDEAALRGVARIFPRQVAVGVKAFAFGWHEPIDPNIWTDDGSAYVELHGGPSPTFWDTITLEAGQALEWTETWLPLHSLPTLSLATSELAMGVKAVGEDLSLGLLAAGQRSDVSLGLWQGSDCTLLWREDRLDMSPGQAYTHTVAGVGLSAESVVLGVLEDGDLLAATGNLTCPLPSSRVDALSTVQTSTDFGVRWRGIGASQGIAGYDVQVRDGDAEATWMDWLTDTTTTSATFSGQDGHTYTFRSRIRDAIGNLEAWPTGKWQDAFTTVLLQPAPVLITSDKMAQPLKVRPGDVLEFQIHLSNTGNLAASVQIADPLPANLTLSAGPFSSHPPDPEFISHTVTWSGTLDAGQTDVAIGFDARAVKVSRGGIVTNAVWIDDGVHPTLRRQVAISGRFQIYVPLILKTDS